MAKLTAWAFTLIGILWTLPLIGVDQLNTFSSWFVPLAFLVVGIAKLQRNYSTKRR